MIRFVCKRKDINIMNKKIIIKSEKLCKSFSNGGIQQHVLKNLDIQIYDGDFTVIMGPSGAGKSTLLYALSGMDRPTLGNIEFSNTCISKKNQDQLAIFRRKHCGFVFQQIYLVDGMSIMDNILAAGLLANKNKQQVFKQAKELLKSVGLDEHIWHKFPTQLSGGEAQRAGLVRAMINKPDIIFAPTGQLNSQSSDMVLNTLTQMNERGQTIVMVTHDLKSARRANRILYLQDGVIQGEYQLGKYQGSDEKRHEKLAAFLLEMGW